MLATEENWPQFRGPNGDGVATTADPPIHWSETRNVAWKVRLPGRGRSSPVVLGNRIWLTTAYETPADREEIQKRLRGHPQPGDVDLAARVVLAVVCLDRNSAKPPDEKRHVEPARGENTLDSGLIAHYPFDKDTADAAGKHHATVTGKAVDVAEPPTLSPASPAIGPVEATIALKNSQGLRWQLEKRGGRWTLGTLFVHDKPVDAPLAAGIMALNNIKSGQVFWPAAAEAKQLDERSARFTGSEKIGDVLFRFEVDAALKEDVPAATLAPRWSVDKELNGFEVCLAYQGVGTNDWRVQSYPFAGNSERTAITPMRYCGVPGALVYRPDLSMVMLFAIDMQFDYLNPTTWTGKTGFHFINRRMAPQFRCCGGKFSAGVRYEHPVQLFFSDTREFASAIRSIMESWIRVNNYKVDESLSVRTPQGSDPKPCFRILLPVFANVPSLSC
jgi:hypothetical protein